MIQEESKQPDSIDGSEPGNAGKKQEDGRSKTWFKPGQSGNPAGKTKGTRNAFCKAMLKDFADTWKEGGIDALRKVMDEKPELYVRAAMHWVPREFDLGDNTQGAFRQIWEALATGKVPAQPSEEADED